MKGTVALSSSNAMAADTCGTRTFSCSAIRSAMDLINGSEDGSDFSKSTSGSVFNAPRSVCRGGWGSRLNASSYRGDILLDGTELQLGELAMIAKPNPLYGSLYFMVIPIAPMVVFQLADDHNAPTHELRQRLVAVAFQLVHVCARLGGVTRFVRDGRRYWMTR